MPTWGYVSEPWRGPFKNAGLKLLKTQPTFIKKMGGPSKWTFLGMDGWIHAMRFRSPTDLYHGLDVFLVAKNGKLIMEIEVHLGRPRLSTYKWSDMGR